MSADTLPLSAVGRSALAKASWRLLPLIALGYGVAYMDRVNISFAALQMNRDLHFSASVYGLGAGLFFLSYAAFEVPSNLLLMRFGARRWLARIMLTWGALAVGMMFVRTPTQFYVMRFLLGFAEAGFFPGSVFYLMSWFPAAHRGRAISRFYVALPVSTIIMGALAGTLLGLGGHLGLKGWQWLFLVEGLPALILSVVFLVCLPNSPETAPWMTAEEVAWVRGALAADAAALGPPSDHRLIGVLANPLVWVLGLSSLLVLGQSYAFNLSGPTILKGATGFSDNGVGWLTAAAGVLGVFGMLGNGWHSDHQKERIWHVAIPLIVMAATFAVMGLSRSAVPVIAAYGLMTLCNNAIQGAFWTIPSDALEGRSAGLAVAAIGSISMLGAFAGPWAFGVIRDQTGGYQLGIVLLALTSLGAAALLFLVPRLKSGVGAARAAVATP